MKFPHIETEFGFSLLAENYDILNFTTALESLGLNYNI